MSFTKRNLTFEIQLNKGPDFNPVKDIPLTFHNGATKLSLSGLRSRVTAQSCIGGDAAYAGRALIQIWGMKPADMAKLSTMGFDQAKIGWNNIKVFASDAGSLAPSTVFDGGIFDARINYNAMPDVSLELECWSSMNEQIQAIPGTSAPGASDLAAMLRGISAACVPPLDFLGPGIDAVLANHAVGGSPADQIEDICIAAGICYTLQGGKLTVWPKEQAIDDLVITTGPGMGLVGFPEYRRRAIDITMEFNPQVQLGRQITINTAPHVPSVPGLPGTFWLNIVEHDLSCELPDGPWFTHATVSDRQIVGRV